VYLEVIDDIHSADLLLVNLASPNTAIVIPGLLVSIRTLNETTIIREFKPFIRNEISKHLSNTSRIAVR
jgi:hypothetical protein